MFFFAFLKGDGIKRKRKSLQLPRRAKMTTTKRSNDKSRQEITTSAVNSSSSSSRPSEPIFELELDEDSTEDLFSDHSSFSDSSSSSSEIPSFPLTNLLAANKRTSTEKQTRRKKRGRPKKRKEVITLSSDEDDEEHTRRSLPPPLIHVSTGILQKPQVAAASVGLEETPQLQVRSSDTTPVVSPSNWITMSCSVENPQDTIEKLDQLKKIMTATEPSNQDILLSPLSSGSALLSPPLVTDMEQTANASQDMFFPSQDMDSSFVFDFSSQPDQDSSDSEGENAVTLIAKQGQTDYPSSTQGIELSPKSMFQAPSLVSIGRELSTQPHCKLKQMSVVIEKLNCNTIITCTRRSEEREDTAVTSLPVSISLSKLCRIPCGVFSSSKHNSVCEAAAPHIPPEQSSRASKLDATQVTDPKNRNEGVVHSANFSRSCLPPFLGANNHKSASVCKDSCKDAQPTQLFKSTKISSRASPSVSITPTETLLSDNDAGSYVVTRHVNSLFADTSPVMDTPVVGTRPMTSLVADTSPVNTVVVGTRVVNTHGPVMNPLVAPVMNPLVADTRPVTNSPVADTRPVTNSPVADTRPVNTTVVGTRLMNTTVVGTRPVNTTVVGTRPVNTTVVGTRPVNTTVVGTRPVNTTVVGTRPMNTTVVGTRPVNTTVVGTRPVNTTVVGTRPMNTTVVGTRPVNTTVVGTRPVNTTVVGTRPVNTTVVGTRPVNTTVVGTRPVNTTVVGTRPMNTTVVGTRPVNTTVVGTRPVNTATRPVNLGPMVARSRPTHCVNTKPRKIIKLHSLYGHFLSWDPAWFLYPERNADGTTIRPWFNFHLPDAVPLVFSEYEHYFDTFVPLLLTELWDSVSINDHCTSTLLLGKNFHSLYFDVHLRRKHFRPFKFSQIALGTIKLDSSE